MSDAVSQIKARLMSYLFGACQPDHGNVFGWFDDHADEALEFALRDHLAASPSVGGWGEPVAWRVDASNGMRAFYGSRENAVADSRINPNATVTPLYAAPPPVSTGSRPQEAVPTEQADGVVVAALQDLLVAVTYTAPARTFAGVLAYEARIPVEFVERADAALGVSRPQPAEGCSSNEGAGK